MSIKRLFLAGLMLLPLVMSTPARAVNLSNQTINSIQQNIKPAIPANAVIKKTSPVNTIPLACPKLFAKGLRVVRVVPQPARGGVQTYRFILDGNIANRGATGVANAGFNVTQSVQGKPGKRIALKLFKKQVNKKQVLDVSRDLRVTIQSDALSRAQVSHTVFKMNVTNLRNDQGACGDYNPTVSTLSAAQLSRALPAQVRGVSQQVGVIPPARRPPARSGFAAPALPDNGSLKTQKPVHGLNQPPIPKIKAGRPVPVNAHPVIPGMPVSAQSKPAVIPMPVAKQKPLLKPVQGFGLAPQATTKKPLQGRNGFAPKVAAGSFGLNKPVTAIGGKPLLPPDATAGSRHVLHDDHAPQPRIGGFAPVLGVNADIAHAPVTGPGGGSLLPHSYQLRTKLEILDSDNNHVLREVDQRQAIIVRLTVHNTGTAPSPRFKISSRRYGEHGPISALAPGQSYQMGFRDGVGGDHISADNRHWFTGNYTLRTVDGEEIPLIRAEARSGLMVPVRGVQELVVTGISNIRLTMTEVPLDQNYNLPGKLKQGIDESVIAKVTIANYGNAASAEMRMTLMLESRGAAVAPRLDSSLTNTGLQAGNGAPGGTMSYEMTVPGIPAGSSITRDITFRHVLHELWARRIRRSQGLGLRHTTAHLPVALGAYACGKINWGKYQGWSGSSFRITASLPVAEGVRVGAKVVTGTFAITQDSYSCGIL